MSDIKSRVQEDMKSAMRSKETLRLGTIRLLLSAIKQKEIDEQVTLNDDAIMSVINKMIKQRRESIEQFRNGNRPELAEKEEQEIAILTVYLPAQLSAAEVEKCVIEAIQTTGAKSIKDMGAIMGQLRPKLQGRADMTQVSALIKSKLN